jgi:ABC-type bacteriocin/lantibiotic exporter with double-glycine peptidase domain
MLQKIEQVMNLIKFFITVLLLVFSTQSLALFMPAGFQINTDTVVASNDTDC